MASKLENHVLKLHECLNDQLNSSDSSRSIISDIIHVCGEHIDSHTIAFCLSRFFQNDKNLLTFLRKAVNVDQLRGCKVELLQFLHKFIIASGKQILPFSADIKETCVLIFNSDKYADVRCATFPIMTKILELASFNIEASTRLNLKALMDTYFVALATQSKLSLSLKAETLTILGVICRYYTEMMAVYQDKCLNLFLNNLKAEMDVKNHAAELVIIAGTFEALNHFLHNYTQSAEEGSTNAKLFDYLKRSLSKKDELKYYSVPKAALNLIAKHAEQFDEFIYSDSAHHHSTQKNYRDLFKLITEWTTSKNYDMKKVSYLALDAYYKQMSEMLRKKAKTDKEKCKRIFDSFIKTFHDILKEDKDLKETSIAIKGYGAFAGPCKELSTPKEVKEIFNEIIEICEKNFFTSSNQQQQSQAYQSFDVFDEKVYQLPSFIESLASVCKQIDDTLPEGSLIVLEKLVILAIDSYPRLVKRYNYQISHAIAYLFISIQFNKSKVYTEFISRCIYQSLMKIFSYRTTYYFQQDQYENNQRSLNEYSNAINSSQSLEEPISVKSIYNITSNSYVMFWSNLLNLTEFKELNFNEISPSDRANLVEIIYDEYVETVIKIIKKLDFSAVKLSEITNEGSEQSNKVQNEIVVSSNPVTGLRPLKPRDFEILVNLVDFTKELLIQKDFNLFEKWMYTFSKEIILLSSKYPLISGFYKLNTLCMRISIKVGYFNDTNKPKNIKQNLGDSEIMEMEEDSTLANSNQNENESWNDSLNADKSLEYEKTNCFYLYKKFVKEIFVRMKQYKDELLASCLEFLLSLPKELVAYNLEEVFQALQISLDLGTNYLPMAENAIQSLEYWIKNLKADQLKPYYCTILNKFDDYLQINKIHGEDESVVQEKIFLLKKIGGGRKKLPLNFLEKNIQNNENSDLYEQMQIRILKILGQLAGEMSHCLFENNSKNQFTVWDTIEHLQFEVPFVDLKPSIYFDKFLPRIIYLALSSTNRQTKVVSCELLHAIVVFMIGKSVSTPLAFSGELSNKSFQMNKLYNRIYPALFKLSCDVDHFARNLFHPLVMQMIHWFTGNRQYESLETVELLNCIMNSLVDEKDAALRDFSATALNEFLKWSIKHTPLAKQDASTTPTPVNVKSILKRIFSFLTHPTAAKRLGAALAWNSIYKIFREEESLVDKHIFELLYYLVESLALAEKDDKFFGTQEQSKLGLDHVERIIFTKKVILNQKNPERIKPAGWSESILEVAVRWLMRQCGRIQTECRHKCMALAYNLAPCIDGIKDTKSYFTIKLERESELYFLARFEGSSETKKEILKDSICNYKTLNELGIDHFQLSLIKTWLSMLIAPLDCYSWVFGADLLTPSNLFANNKSCIWTSLKYFIEHIANYDLLEVIKLVYCKSLVVCTPNELEEYRNAKCTVIIRLIDFICVLLGRFPKESIKIIPMDSIFSEKFFTCIVNICLDPKLVGFNLSDLEVYSNLPNKTRDFLSLAAKNLPPSIQERLKSVCKNLIQERKQFKSIIDDLQAKKLKINSSLNELETSENDDEKAKTLDWLQLSQLVNGFEQLNEFNLYEIPLDLNRMIFEYLTEEVSVSSIYQEECLTSIDAKRKLFNLCLNVNNSSLKKHSNSYNKDYLIELVDKYLFLNNDKGILTLFNNYKNEISEWLCKRYNFILNHVFTKIVINFANCANLMLFLLEYLGTNKQMRKQFGSSIVNIIYENWDKFKSYWQINEFKLENKTILLNLLYKSILIERISFEKPKSKAISEMYMSMLIDTTMSLSFKSKLLDLLFIFCSSPEPFSIKAYINKFTRQFPLKCSELVKGEDAYNDYMNSIRKMLTALEISLSWDLLDSIVNIFCRESEHICDDELQVTLTKFIKTLSLSDNAKQLLIIKKYWDIYLNTSENSYDDRSRKVEIFKKVLMNFLTNCDKPTFIEFMCINIFEITDILSSELKEISYDSLCSNKKNAFELIELAYKRLHKDEIFFPSAKLCTTYETNKFGQPRDGKELTKFVISNCRKFLFETLNFTSNIDADMRKRYGILQRKLHCSAYNCLVALFIRTQNKIEAFQAFLFKENASKKELIFERLVEKDMKYNFLIELEDKDYQNRKTKFISLRKEFKESSESDDNQLNVNYISSLNSTNTMINNALQTASISNNQRSYLNTQNMLESSLSEELSIFDFTSNSISKASSFTTLQSVDQSISEETTRKTNGLYLTFNETNDKEDAPIEIELDDLNQHESMCSFVELIQALFVNKITTIYEKGVIPNEMPIWMTFLHRKITDQSTTENVKFFLIRGIINTQKVFKIYAKFWYGPLISFLINSSLAKNEGMDYFTLDLMVLLLSWYSIGLPGKEEMSAIKKLFENLIERCFHLNRAILKNNIELLKTMTECWKDLIHVPVNIIYNYLKSTDDPKKLTTGIQLFGVVLANQILNYDYPSHISKLEFYKALIDCIKNPSKPIYSSSAEVIGMLFKSLSPLTNQQNDSRLFEETEIYLLEVLKKIREKRIEIFITCVHRISINYAPISERHMAVLVFNLPKLNGELKLWCAESILVSIGVLEDAIFKNEWFTKMITHRDSALQLVCLKMIHSSLRKQSEDELARLIKLICDFIYHPNISCRYQMMLTLIDVYQVCEIKATEPTAKNSIIKKLTNETLLKALLDDDQVIRLMAQNFWTQKAGIPQTTIDRMVMLLEKMYSADTEIEYLSYSTNLLLEKTSNSPDWNLLIYKNALTECKFTEYNLTADWRRRHEMMTPLFVETMNQSLQSSLSFDLNSQPSMSEANNFAGLRATQAQTLQFEPTQDSSKRSTAYNWLTQSSMDNIQTSMLYDGSLFSESQSSLLFSATKRAIKLLNKNEKRQDKTTDSDNEIFRLRKRFLKENVNDDHQNRHFARKQIEKKDKEEEIKKQLKLKRQSHVEKYRKYRIGDFPDIQIKYSELIAPLQALAQRDSQIAMILFDSLFESILSALPLIKNDEEITSITKSIESHINSMLASSNNFNPNFIKCLLEIAIKHASSFRLDAKLVSNACFNSLQQPLGIMLLEEYIILENDDTSYSSNINITMNEFLPPQNKKAKYSEGFYKGNDESLLWIELAKLYRSMNDYDSIKGIFLKKKNLTTEYTQNGFNFESNCNYFQAKNCYLAAFRDKNLANVSQEEKELWHQSLLQCCNELTDWKEMSEYSTREAKLQDLFANDLYSFTYAFRSKLKLLLQEGKNENTVDLLVFIKNLKSEDKAYLEELHGTEMALFNIYENDLNAAKHFAQNAIKKYLMEWSSINKTIIQGRMTKLQSLQSIIELEHFLNFVNSNTSYHSFLNEKVNQLIDLWSNSMPNKYSDPPCTWDDIITNRCVYYNFIEAKYYSTKISKIKSKNVSVNPVNMSVSVQDEEDEDLTDYESKKLMRRKLQTENYIMKIKFAQAAQYQGNNKLALIKLEQTNPNAIQDLKPNLEQRLMWAHCYFKTRLSVSKSTNNLQDSLCKFFQSNVLKEIIKYDEEITKSKNSYLALNKDINKEHQIIHSQFCKFLIKSFLDWEKNDMNCYNFLKSDSKYLKHLMIYTKTESINNIEDSLIKLMKHGLRSLQGSSDDLKSSLELASYCDYFLRLVENDEENLEDSVLKKLDFFKNEFPLIITNQLLNAIRLNSYEARQRFPRLLQIVELYGEKILNVFIKESENIPCWMFLGWLSQMTALLDKNEAIAVQHIVKNIANEYPQAFIYPFKMSLESFKFTYETGKQKEFVERLKLKINEMTLVNQFIASLEQFSNPALMFIDYCNEIAISIKSRDKVLEIFQRMYNDLFDLFSANETSFSGSSSQNDHLVEWGNVRRDFAKNFKNKFDEEFGKNGQLILSLNEESLKDKVTQLRNEVEAYKKKMRDYNLGEYSPWLKTFKRNTAKDLEIPGQYSGKSKPMLEYHIKIEGFDERIIVMKSIRQPKCITIRGNDQKEHKFLVKGGEDQRQDQRIEMLFDLINDLLKSDSKCYQRNLSLKTYQVIPMTNKLALIEWLPETKTLKDAIYESRNEEDVRKWEMNNPSEMHHKFISNASKDLNVKLNITDIYGFAFNKYKRDVATDAFKNIENLVPWDLLRRFIRSMSSSSESYFVLRNQFITSYAVASTCQYILGIGDRHLSNWIIDTKSGRAIGIDFGMAFGHATVNIPVPELAPIRLTRQILKLIAPLEHCGLLEASMLHTLRALRENNDLLMCILDVFIKEPSIDWIGSASRIAKRTLNENFVDARTQGIQYAKKRLNSAKNKLDGINPCVITRNDLMEGVHKESKYLKFFLNVVLGKDCVDKDGNPIMKRTKFLEKNGENYRLTLEEQIQCIIEQATDPSILSRTWTGWEPFI